MKNTKHSKIKSVYLNLEKQTVLHYGIEIENELVYFLREYSYDKIFFLCDNGVFEHHGCRLINIIRNAGIEIEHIPIVSHENNKSFSGLEKVCNELIKKHITKESIIIGFGGGMTCNLSGMAAALIYRGIKYFEIPTTFMGQSDSSISNKQAINGMTGKNQIGTYYSPEFIWADIKYLLTESKRNTIAGIVEGVKNGFISDSKFLKRLVALIKKYDNSEEKLYQIYKEILESKNKILQNDPTERKYAVVLEYGHTFGHAIEFLTNEEIIHGEAVAIGMCIAAELSYILGYIDYGTVDYHYYIVDEVLKIDNKHLKNISVNSLFKALSYDNKRYSDGVKYVLLEKEGICISEDGEYQVYVNEKQVIKAISRYFKRCFDKNI